MQKDLQNTIVVLKVVGDTYSAFAKGRRSVTSHARSISVVVSIIDMDVTGAIHVKGYNRQNNSHMHINLSEID